MMTDLKSDTIKILDRLQQHSRADGRFAEEEEILFATLKLFDVFSVAEEDSDARDIDIALPIKDWSSMQFALDLAVAGGLYLRLPLELLSATATQSFSPVLGGRLFKSAGGLYTNGAKIVEKLFATDIARSDEELDKYLDRFLDIIKNSTTASKDLPRPYLARFIGKYYIELIFASIYLLHARNCQSSRDLLAALSDQLLSSTQWISYLLAIDGYLSRGSKSDLRVKVLKCCRKLLSKALLKSDGVLSLLICMFPGNIENIEEASEPVVNAVKHMISTPPSKDIVGKDEYYQNISAQLLCLIYNDSKTTNSFHQSLAVCIVYQIISEDWENHGLFDKLLETRNFRVLDRMFTLAPPHRNIFRWLLQAADNMARLYSTSDLDSKKAIEKCLSRFFRNQNINTIYNFLWSDEAEQIINLFGLFMSDSISKNLILYGLSQKRSDSIDCIQLIGGFITNVDSVNEVFEKMLDTPVDKEIMEALEKKIEASGKGGLIGEDIGKRLANSKKMSSQTFPDLNSFDKTIQLLESVNEPYIRAMGASELRKIIVSDVKKNLSNQQLTKMLDQLLICLTDSESYVQINAMKTAIALLEHYPGFILPKIVDAYLQSQASPNLKNQLTELLCRSPEIFVSQSKYVYPIIEETLNLISFENSPKHYTERCKNFPSGLALISKFLGLAHPKNSGLEEKIVDACFSILETKGLTKEFDTIHIINQIATRALDENNRELADKIYQRLKQNPSQSLAQRNLE